MSTFKAVVEYVTIYGYLAYMLILTMINSVVNRFRGSPAPQNLTGKTVLITGAGGGLGRSIALEFARHGCQLALIDVNKADVQRVSGEVKTEFAEVNVRHYVCDLTKTQQLEQVLASVRRDFGNKDVDILVNNAGVANGKPFEELTQKDWELTFGVNVLAHFSLCHALLPGMIASGYGHIVSVSSIVGLYGFTPRTTDYVASKFAAVGFMEALDYELHSKGVDSIGLTTVCPYMIATPMFAGTVPSRFPAALPILSPEDVAKKLVEGVKYRKRLVILPSEMVQHVMIKNTLPKSLTFAMADFTGVAESLNNFVGRAGCHNGNGEVPAK